MADVDGTEAEARQIQRDIERTREEMDHTLTELERRLSPSELLHSGAETVRERVRSGATSTVETLKQHPLPIALAAALLGARLALRPSAADRRRRAAEQDIDRAMAVLGAAFERAQERAQVGASSLVELVREAFRHPDRYTAPTWRTMQRAMEESRIVGGSLRREAGAYPLGALALFGMAAATATLASRAVRGWR